MKKKILIGSIIAVALLTLVSFSSVVGYNSIDKNPVPDLDCDGDIAWVDVEPGETIIGTITVENIGEPDSMLNWEIVSFPDWGTWTFVPYYGTDVLFGEIITIVVEVVLPDEIEEDLYGEIFFVNLDNPNDNCIIDVWIHIHPIDDATTVEFELQRIRDLVQSIDLWKIIVNPDAVVDTLEEISTIIEEEDVRNYIEKSSEEDCGCEEDSSYLGWFFPAICTLLVPLWGIAALIVLVSNGVIWQPVEIMAQIGLSLNCYWIN